MTGLRLYARLLGMSIRGQLQYRGAVAMQSVGQLLVTGIEILGVWALFERFGEIQGWTLAEVALFYGVVNVGFSLADASARGFDLFSDMIKRGDFDRVLLRPRSAALQIAGQEITLKRVGRLLQGLIVLCWAWSALGLPVTPGNLLMLAWTLLGAGSMFYGLVVVQATISFWTTESLELMNALTYGGVETAQYPMAIYRAWFRRFFTFVVPLACVSYFPVVALMGRPDPLGSPLWFQTVSPAAGLIFLGVSMQIWRVGVRHYSSTGS